MPVRAAFDFNDLGELPDHCAVASDEKSGVMMKN
jgi:hypothetical protein